MIQINLHPDHHHHKSWHQTWRHLQPRSRLVVICVIVLLGVTLIAYALAYARYGKSQNAHVPAAQPKVAPFTSAPKETTGTPTADTTRQNTPTELPATVTDLHSRWPTLLHTIASALPPNTWLIELAQIYPAITPTTPPDSALAAPTLRLTGQTTDLHALSLFMQRLQEYEPQPSASHPPVSYVVLNRSDLISITEEVTQFELDLKIVTPNSKAPNVIPVTNNATLLRALSTLARAHNVELSTLEPPPTLTSSTIPTTATCNVGAIASYHNLARFFLAIATPPHAFIISGITIVPYTPGDAQTQPDTTRPADSTTSIHATFQIHQFEPDPLIQRTQIAQHHLTIPPSVNPFRSLRNTPELRPTISDLRLTTIAYDHTSQKSVAVLIDHQNTPHRLHVGQRIGRLTLSAILPRTIELTYHELGVPRRVALAISSSTNSVLR